ncbi:sugar phosphate isomerase/epimerase family protein [Kineococcus rhizosphaerae]|uniref:Sugar phosphate isomerase/epimerase n=1 Tax=Kineococcus rhizosphaerae TaxID=559628 RepID=A0A2T0QSB9_9ACTN|nr:sugar phosphate isomerase/epimerase [Kineococcus rhizosphaerae]PRY07801.1 sugar phosphate isomerase/epimerase [Kineococcus rhizosphaerae]
MTTTYTTQNLATDKVLCSTITLRHLPLREALQTISELGFTGVDLGALPGVCNHVPYELNAAAVREVTAVVRDSGLIVRSVNADVGDLNVPLTPAETAARREHADRLLDLCTGIGANALVLPNGRQDHEPVRDLASDLELVAEQLRALAELTADRQVELWVEAPHHFRLVHDVDLASSLYELLPASIGAVLDVSHIVAAGSTPRRFLELFADRVRHVHLRDAEPGYIHHSIGRGAVDFPDTITALSEYGYQGLFALELETRDLADRDRPTAALKAGEYISSLIMARAAQD